MHLTSSRPDIMFAVCACARYQVNLKVSHLYAVKKIFRYLKGQPKLGLWYPKDSLFDLVAYTDSDYAGASLDRKSTTGEADYVAALSCCGQMLWIQNQLLNYGSLLSIRHSFPHNGNCSKKQKLEEDKESEELKKCFEIVPNDGDDVTIDATPLSIKSPSIVD
ncbi:hypothetical protein Tco_1083976 [Tanacetum coccineum]